MKDSLSLPPPEREAIHEKECADRQNARIIRHSMAMLKRREKVVKSLTPTGDPWTAVTVPKGFTGRLLGVYTDGSQEWLAAREGRIGASELGTICGWNEWETRADLLARKRGELPPRPTTAAMTNGHYHELSVAPWFADKTGVEYLNSSDGTYVHPDHEWAMANPDRVCADGSLLEIKSTKKDRNADNGWGRAGTDQIPRCYAAQVQWQMFVTGLRVAHVAVLSRDVEFAKYKVPYDPEMVAFLFARAAAFHEDMIAHPNTKDAA